MNTFSIDLEIDKSSPLSPEGIAIRQGDVNGTTLIATIYDHGTKLATTGLTPYLIMELPDHEHSYSQAGTYSSGVVTVIINERQAASVSGVVENAYIELRQSSTVIASTESFRVVIRPDARADKEIGETYSSEIEAAIQDLETAIAQAETQIETDVAEWLDQHPEATTTVQDNSITYAKLHSSTKQRLGNKLHRAITAPVVTASDAYAAPPVALVVDGKSVQDGTPAPDAPVSIQSVESVGLGAAGKNLYSTPLDSGGKTSNGITWTVNADGSITANGTATGFSYIRLLNRQNMGNLVMGQTYVLSGAHDGVRHLTNQTGHGDISSANPLAITLTEGLGFTISLCVTNGTTVDNVTVRPQIELGSTATPYTPYVGSTTAIPLQGHALRSLPDGTHDELRVDAEGNVTLVQRTGSVSADTLASASKKAIVEFADVVRISYARVMEDEPSRQYNGDPAGSGWCNVAPYVNNYTQNAVHAYAHNAYVYIFAPKADKSTWDATTATEWTSEHAPELVYALATPVEIPLGTVTLPALPAPDLTACASCTPATDIELDYERDVTIAVERLEAAIAELATN